MYHIKLAATKLQVLLIKEAQEKKAAVTDSFLLSSIMITVLRLITRLLPLYKPPETYAIDYFGCCQYPIMTSLQDHR